jgi:hypothetical protein
MKTIHNAKALNFINGLSPELKKVVIDIAEDIKPALDDIHAQPATTQNYYADYLRLLSYKPKHAKMLALAMLYAGANPNGVEAAIKLI